MKLLIFNIFLFLYLASTAFAGRPDWVNHENWVSLGNNLGFVIEGDRSEPKQAKRKNKTKYSSTLKNKGAIELEEPVVINTQGPKSVTGYFLVYVDNEWMRVNSMNLPMFMYVE